jgi:hypothetical protein
VVPSFPVHRKLEASQYLLACVRTRTRMCACGVSVVCVVLCVLLLHPLKKRPQSLQRRNYIIGEAWSLAREKEEQQKVRFNKKYSSKVKLLLLHQVDSMHTLGTPSGQFRRQLFLSYHAMKSIFPSANKCASSAEPVLLPGYPLASPWNSRAILWVVWLVCQSTRLSC